MARSAAVALLLCVMLLAGVAAPLRAQEGINIVNSSPRNDFPSGVTFSISFTSAAPPDEVRLRYELAPDGTGATAVAQCKEGATITCTHTLTSGRGIYIIPGAEITWQWEFSRADGNRTATDEQIYVHEDTRFTFFELTSNGVTVFYHAGAEESQAQAVLDAAAGTLRDVGALLQAEVTFPIKVFLYTTADEMQPAIAPTGSRGVRILGEVVYSDTAMVSAGGSMLDITRHEIAHIVTREATKGPFGIPDWLSEGISVYAQNEPLSGHAAALETAIRADRVLTMSQLNSPSSRGVAGTVGLYYGQSGSIVGYLVQTYGEEKFAELVATFREGSRPDNAFRSVYGLDQEELWNEWRAAVGLPDRGAPTPGPEPDDEPRETSTPPGGTSAPDAGDGESDGGGAIAWMLIGVMAVALVGAGVYSFTVIRSRI